MAKVSVFNIEGQEVGELTLNDVVFGAEANEHIVHKAVVHYLAARRQGTQSAKTRAEVRGGGRKPWRQKGTGHARQGSIRAPQWKGGGVVFAPKPRDYSFKMNKKEKALALRIVLSQKVNEGNFVVVEDLKLEEGRTKLLANALKNLNVKAALIVTNDEETVVRAGRNLPDVKTTNVYGVNVYDVLRFEKVIIDKALVAKIEEVCA